MSTESWQKLPVRIPRYQVDVPFYESVRVVTRAASPVEVMTLAPGHGRAFLVNKGQTFRVIALAGPQVGSVTFWNAADHKESFIAARTMSLDGFFVKTHGRLWSDFPPMRPIVTCINDTVVTESSDGHDRHHLIGTHCSAELVEMRNGIARSDSCRVYLLDAIESFGLNERDLHDSVYVHQKARIDEQTGKIVSLRSDAKAGDNIEFYAEIDLLVAVAVCPFGDGADRSGRGASLLRPLGIAIFDTGIEPRPFPRWTDWRPTWSGRWVPPARWIDR
jgi:uncharacterized protein YcgI (DUF1989 family)